MHPKPSDATRALFHAAGSGDVGAGLEALRAGGSADAVDEFGRSVLGLAALRGQIAFVSMLLAEGVSVTAPSEAVSPLLAACEHGLFDSESNEALHAESLSRGRAVVQLLIDAGARIADPLGHDTQRAIFAASRYGKEAVAALLAAGARVDARGNLPTPGSTALLWVSEYGDVEAIDWLLALGADPNAKNDGGATSLSAAMRRYCDRDRVVNRLLDAGAQPDGVVVPQDGAQWRPLVYGLSSKSDFMPETVVTLVQAGAALKGLNRSRRAKVLSATGDRDGLEKLATKLTDPERAAALYYAAAMGHLSCVRLLLDRPERELSVEWQCIEASARGRLAVIQLLWPMVSDARMRSLAVDKACLGGHVEVLRWLAREGAPLDGPHEPLVTAAVHGHAACVDFLLEHGVPPEPIVNGNIYACPIAVTVKRGDVALLELLFRHGIERIVDDKQRKHLIKLAQEHRRIELEAMLVARWSDALRSNH